MNVWLITFIMSVLAALWYIPQLIFYSFCALFGYYQTKDNVWHYSRNYALTAWGMVLVALICTVFDLI